MNDQKHFAGTARDVQRFADEAIGAIVRWYDAGAGSGSHLAESTGLPPSQNLRNLASILKCAHESKDVRTALASLAE